MSDKLVPADYMNMGLAEARRFDRNVKENFMPAFSSVAKQIVDDYGIVEGICIEIGSGTGLLAIELCKGIGLTIYAMEKAIGMYQVSFRNIENEKLLGQIIPVLGDAHDLPFKDSFADLVISRGSYHCWEKKPLVFKEVYRVLQKGGVGFVGGGFGRDIPGSQLEQMLTIRDRSLGTDAEYYYSPEKLKEFIYNASIPHFRIVYDKTGLWAEIKK